jgi:hypothetical protein
MCTIIDEKSSTPLTTMTTATPPSVSLLKSLALASSPAGNNLEALTLAPAPSVAGAEVLALVVALAALLSFSLLSLENPNSPRSVPPVGTGRFTRQRTDGGTVGTRCRCGRQAGSTKDAAWAGRGAMAEAKMPPTPLPPPPPLFRAAGANMSRAAPRRRATGRTRASSMV